MASNHTKPKPQKPSRIYGGLSLEARKAQRKEQFLSAGLAVFGTTGFRNATVRSLCKEAKLTDRYFYDSFGNLENLLKAVYARCITNLSKEILKSIKQNYQIGDAASAITAGLDAYFRELENPQIAQICMVELEGINPEVNKLYYGYINGFSRMLVALANHAFPAWQLDIKQKEVIGISMVGAMRQSATHWLVSDYQIERADLVSASSQLFLGMIKQIKSQSTDTATV